MQGFSTLVINNYPQFPNIVYEHFLDMYYRLRLEDRLRGDATKMLKLSWVYEKISKQNSNALRYCRFQWLELELQRIRQDRWR